MTSQEKILKKNDEGKFICVGLDTDINKIPIFLKNDLDGVFKFNQSIIQATKDYAAAYKINFAFYERAGSKGISELEKTVELIPQDILSIADAKRGDIGNTSEMYAKSIYEHFNFDAVTLHPYLGVEALQPFLDRADKGCIILCRTSNLGAGEFQNLEIGNKPLWQIVAEKVSGDWNKNENCMLVVGATYPKEMQKIRSLVGNMIILVPGIGAQGGSVKEVMNAGLDSDGLGLIINSSRGIIFSDNPREEAKKLCEEIRKYKN